MVEGIGDIHVPTLIDRHSERIGEAALLRGAAVSTELRDPTPSDTSDDLFSSIPSSNQMTVLISDQNITGLVQSNTIGSGQACRKLVGLAQVSVLSTVSR